MAEVFAVLERFAMTEVPVTLLGETGTGKDVLARSVHERSLRAGAPFVVFDCGSVTAGLAESELFGHERGSFTGAIAAHAGAFERAHGGTLFLDEIGELPLDLQPRLLRALESRNVRRVGGMRERTCDVRIVAATNRDLRAEVAAGRFREDLYFRLATAVVVVPPLRDRLDDLEALIPRLLEDLGSGHLAVSQSTIDVLRARRWVGNVRELKNALACAAAFVESDVQCIEPRHLRLAASPSTTSSELDCIPLGGHTLDEIEKAAIAQTLAMSQGNKVRAARSLGIAASTLYEKLRRHGI
jgi:transcriptional regulator with PAS, ATPase and Fis domain